MRRDAREIAFKLVFNYLFMGEKNIQLKEELLHSPEFRIDDDATLVDQLYDGVVNNIDNLNKVIEKHSKGYQLGRLYKTDRAILLVALYEILYMIDIPNAVSVNEGVELAKKYGEEKSTQFINGVLAGVIKEIWLLTEKVFPKK